MQKAVPFLVCLFLTPTVCCEAPAQETAREVIQEAIRAHGGKDKLAHSLIFWCRLKGTATMPDSQTFPLAMELWSQLPDYTKYVAKFDVGGDIVTEVRILNKQEGWVKAGAEKAEQLTKEKVEEEVQGGYAAYVTRLIPLLDEERFSLTLSDEVSVSGRAARVVKVLSEGHPDVLLYFDKDSHLLVKSERQAADLDGKKGLREEYYSD